MIGFREMTLGKLAVEHKLEVNTLAGTAGLSVPLRTSPGRESFGPSLALGYSSGQKNSTFGVGWVLSGVPSIGLDTSKGLPSYIGGETRYVYAGSQQLVPTLVEGNGAWTSLVEDRGTFRVQRFRSRSERSFERFERWTQRTTGRVHWIVYARNGVVSVFGQAADNSTRIADPHDPVHRTFQWLLEAQYHPKGNAIVYQYKPEDSVGVDTTQSFETQRARNNSGFAQRYLKRILYGNSRPLSLAQPTDAANEWHFEAVLDYGEHGTGPVPTFSDTAAWSARSDAFSTYRTGFELRTYRLCRRFLMFHRFPELDGGAPTLVGATELSHTANEAGTTLESISYRGFRKNPDGSTSSRAVPALKLDYSDSSVGTSFEAAAVSDNVPAGLAGEDYQWLDVQNEGLPGILCRQNDSWYFKENLGDGRFGPTRVVDEIPVAVSAAFQLQDFDGDGNLNLVGFSGREAGYYQHNRDQRRWQGFRTFKNLPRVDFANARVQWVDLNGDGHADLIVDRSDRLLWYASQGADGFAPAVEITRPHVRAGGAPTLTQSAGLRTFFADMTGDGLLDMVRVDSGRVSYWPNLGHAAFGVEVAMEGAPAIDDHGEFDSQRLRLVDLDGSGTADLLYIGRGEIRFWINQSGNRFNAEHRLANLPYIDQLASAQVFDFLGDGTRCLRALRGTCNTPRSSVVKPASGSNKDRRRIAAQRPFVRWSPLEAGCPPRASRSRVILLRHRTFSASSSGCVRYQEDEQMGMIKCETHGLSGLYTCCEHIAKAADDGVLEKAYIVLDDWVGPSLVCAPCEQLVIAAGRSTGEPNVGVGHALESPVVGYCDECLCEWFSATGQGDLFDATDRLREPHIKRWASLSPEEQDAERQKGFRDEDKQ